MSVHMNIENMVETKLLRRILVVMRLAHYVAVGPLYDNLSLLTVMRTQWVLALLGLMDTKIRPYVTLLPDGTADLWMKKILFVPLMHFPTLCASIPMPFDNAVVQVPLLGTCISFVYPYVFPVAGSSTPWKATAPSPMASTVWLARVIELRG